MQANFVYEALEDILKPKSKEEVATAYKKIEANRALEQAVQHKNLQGVFDSLKRGASYSSAVSWSSSVTTDESLLLFLSKNGQHLLLANDGVLDLPKELTNVY